MDKLLNCIDHDIARLLDKVMEGKELSVEEGTLLLEEGNRELPAIMRAADILRERAVGDKVTFVHNRNINFTNYCVGDCLFCAFCCPPGAGGGYCLSVEQVVAKAKEAAALGATEVCIQGGLNPELEPDYYVKLCEGIKKEVPAIHIHAFSPMEVYYTARKKGCTVEELLQELKEAGLNSMPGTAAEILDDSVRKLICPSKLSTAQWKDVITAAHKTGIPTTGTIMYGHIEKAYHIAKHLDIVREIQKQTGGFTEFVPLSFVHGNTELYRRDMCGPGASGITDIKVHAVARIMLYPYVKNIQVSWVKLGKGLAQVCLAAGANDMGGTLMEEHISRMAGSSSPPGLTRNELREMISACGRTPAQRTTTYDMVEDVS